MKYIGEVEAKVHKRGICTQRPPSLGCNAALSCDWLLSPSDFTSYTAAAFAEYSERSCRSQSNQIGHLIVSGQ